MGQLNSSLRYISYFPKSGWCLIHSKAFCEHLIRLKYHSIFAFDRCINMLDMYLKASFSLISSFTDCLTSSSLICSGGIRTLSDSTKEWYFTFYVLGIKWLFWGWGCFLKPVSIAVVLRCITTVLQTKTTNKTKKNKKPTQNK